MADTTLASLEPIRTTSATDQVFDTLYSAVVTLDLPPGTKVSEADVARQLGVSRQPVRDAFFRLSKLGFLLIRPQRATLITKISETDVLEAMFIRLALEIACLNAAIEVVTDDDIKELETMIEEQADAVASDERLKFQELDDAFHRRICEISGHGSAWNIIRELKAHMDRVRYLSLTYGARDAFDDHVAILEAMRTRDKGAAEARLKVHLGRIRDIILQIRSEHSQYFDEGDA
jgi:DNA-binding GntR family transcriptional regulator